MITIQEKHIKNLLLILLGAFIFGILGSNFFIYPAFTRMVIHDAETEAVMITRHISNMLFGQDTGIKPDLKYVRERLDEVMRDFELQKLKVFDENGKTILSTDEQDVGIVNSHDYFQREVVRGNVFTKVVQQHTQTLEGQQSEADVVETYVPVMHHGKFSGALEVYYDISGQQKVINEALLYSNILSIGFAAVFLLFCLVTARRLDQNIAERDNAQQFLQMVNLDLKEQIEQRLKAEKEREKVIADLEQSLEKIKVLSGLVPICSFCKNIRNDAGYWEQMELYIEKYSDAEFSHGLCPSCAAKHYPGIDLDEDNPPADCEQRDD